MGEGRTFKLSCSEISLMIFWCLTLFSYPRCAQCTEGQVEGGSRCAGLQANFSVAGQSSVLAARTGHSGHDTAPIPGNSPSHTGAAAVHTPEAVHCTTSGPTNANPSSQLKWQLDGYWNASAECGQVMLPRSGVFRGGQWAARNKHRAPVWETSGHNSSFLYLPQVTGEVIHPVG